jgi:hypothetical protein
MREVMWIGVGMVGLLLTACRPADPPTITPSAAGPTPGSPGAVVVPGDERVVTLTMAPGATRPPDAIEPVMIEAVTAYQDAEGQFSLEVPEGWTETRKTDALTGDAKLGTVFVAPNGNGLLSITHFDNGKVPASLGGTANGVMKLTGITDEPDFLEIGRSAVADRPETAMISEITYTRRNSGVPMHALLLFQIDGTTFSLMNVAVEQKSWNENEGIIRDIVASYQVPAGAAGTPASP